MSTANRPTWTVLVVAAVLAAGAGFAVAVWAPRSIIGFLGSDEDAAERREILEEARSIPGLWHRVRTRGAEAAGLDATGAEQLADLPYLAGYEGAPSDLGGVVAHDPRRAHQGLNLVVSGHAAEALLLDMDGRVLHRWARTLESVWPEAAADRDPRRFNYLWRRARLLPDGELLAIYDGIGLIKVDPDSELLWAYDGRAHHDVRVEADGTIYTLTRRRRRSHPALEVEGSIEEDFVTRLTAEGEVIDELSILDALASSEYASLLVFARREGDLLHTNTLERLDGRFAERHQLYEEGNLLVSLPRLNTVAVIDPDAGSIVWALTGMFRFQHQPVVVEDGRILLFDNAGENGKSRVIEIDPLTQQIEWEYKGTAEQPLVSYFLGSCQRLPNGNTLITESTGGRGVEVTRDGEVVWEYVNPFRAGEDDRLIASLFEVVRIDPATLAPRFLDRLGIATAESP